MGKYKHYATEKDLFCLVLIPVFQILKNFLLFSNGDQVSEPDPTLTFFIFVAI
jgi:hypothetical protein